jgi:hypothetical protein
MYYITARRRYRTDPGTQDSLMPIKHSAPPATGN